VKNHFTLLIAGVVVLLNLAFISSSVFIINDQRREKVLGRCLQFNSRDVNSVLGR